MELLFGIFSAFGLSASAGLNAYIPLLVVGVTSHYFPGVIALGQPWDILANPWVLIVLGILVIIEMLADKVPAVNHINDIIQTFIRPAAGAVVFAASTNAVTGIHPVLAIICGLLVAGTVHTAKAAVVRPMVTAATAGAGNVPVSVAEDVAATGVSILALVIPVVMGIVLIVVLSLLLMWYLRRKDKQQTA